MTAFEGSARAPAKFEYYQDDGVSFQVKEELQHLSPGLVPLDLVSSPDDALFGDPRAAQTLAESYSVPSYPSPPGSEGSSPQAAGGAPAAKKQAASTARGTKKTAAADPSAADGTPSAAVFSPAQDGGEQGTSKKHKLSEKRVEQNRQAQIAFRERKKRYVKDLEEKLATAAQFTVAAEFLKQENSDLRQLVMSLQSENERLKHENRHLANFTWTPAAPVPSFDQVAGQYSLPQHPPFSFTPAVPSSAGVSEGTSSEGSPSSSADSTDPLSSPDSSREASSFSSPAFSADSQGAEGGAGVGYEAATSAPLSDGYFAPHSYPEPDLSPGMGGPLPSPSITLGGIAVASPSNLFSSDFPELDQHLYQQPQFTQPQHLQQSNFGDLGLSLGDDFPLPTSPWSLESFIDEAPLAPNLAPAPTPAPTSTSPPAHPHKRNLDEASIYTPATFTPKARSKDEQGELDATETEICNLFKQIHCKDKNPELCKGSKYVKKAM